MNDFDVTGTDFHLLGAVELRKFAAKAGVKGASKGKKADLIAALEVIEAEQLKAAEDEAAAAKAAAEAAKTADQPVKGKCNVCGTRRAARDTNGQCAPCFEEGGWENTHNDAGHAEFNLAALTEEQAEEVFGCWICYPELNKATRPARKGVSRVGQVIVAKGTEIHKSLLFKTEAEKAGWTVTIQTETYELPGDATGEGTRHYATATKGESHISLAWDGRKYDYPESGASFNGKARKVRNLKEALRLI